MATAELGCKRGPYKRYMSDPSCPIPRQTLANWQHKDTEVQNKEQLADETAVHGHGQVNTDEAD